MAKKKNPDQAEDIPQEEEVVAPEEEQPEEEAVVEEPETEEVEGEDTEDPEEEAGDPDPAPEGAEEPAAEAPTPAADDEVAGLRAELLEARSQLAAYAAGVAPDMVADAVTLATAEAQRVGEVTETAIAQAMANVLKRHPEWKADAVKSGAKKTGGFKVGSDRDNGSAYKKPASTTTQNAKRWNRFK